MKWQAKPQLNRVKAFPPDNQGSLVHSNLCAFLFFTQNIKETYTQELTFNEINICYCFIKDSLQ